MSISNVLKIGLVWMLAANASAATLKIATLSPDGSAWMKALRSASETIEARTDGGVKFKFYPGGVMGDDKAVLRKMRVGQLHGAVLTAGGLLGAYKDIALYNMPMLFRNEAEVDYVRARFDEKLLAGLRDSNFVGFGIAEVGFAYPMSKLQVSSVPQFRQRKVWTPDNDPGSLAAFKAFDITPIPLPIADVLAGLQTGLIDTIGSPPIGAIVLQWFTQVEYAVDLPLMYVYGLMALAERPFEKLSTEHQTIVGEELRKSIKSVNASARNDHTNAKNVLTSAGIDWLTPDAPEAAEWDKLAATARDKMVAEGSISKEFYDEVLGYLAEYRAANR